MHNTLFLSTTARFVKLSDVSQLTLFHPLPHILHLTRNLQLLFTHIFQAL